MKKVIFIGLLAFAILAGAALAEQAGEQKKGSSMRGMMQGMMGQMTKMMDHGRAMMESMHTESGQTKEGQKK